jgi:hypothetical protein
MLAPPRTGNELGLWGSPWKKLNRKAFRIFGSGGLRDARTASWAKRLSVPPSSLLSVEGKKVYSEHTVLENSLSDFIEEKHALRLLSFFLLEILPIPSTGQTSILFVISI